MIIIDIIVLLQYNNKMSASESKDQQKYTSKAPTLPHQPTENQLLLLEYYHIDSAQQLVAIMIDPEKSSAYNHIRTHPTPHLDLQNINTLKSLIDYKRLLVLGMFQNVHKKMTKEYKQIEKEFKNGIGKEKCDDFNSQQKYKMSHKQKQRSKNKEKQKRKYSQRLQDKEQQKFQKILLNMKNFGKNFNLNFIQQWNASLVSKINSIKNIETIKISNHSYEQLSSYFKTNNSPQLCRKILEYKYSRNQVIQAHSTRKQFWLKLIGIEQKRQQYPFIYETILKYQQYHDFFNKIIHADAVRTIQDGDEKQSKENLEMMERILCCFARRNPYIGYCQGMNFILNFIMTMQFQQQQCFWILVRVIEQITPLGYYTNMSGVAVDIKILDQILKITHPKIASKFKKLQIDLSVFVLQWLVCLFTTTLPFYLLTIVWDLILIEGSTALLKTALIFLEYIGKIVQQTQDFAQFFKLYQKQKKKKFFIQEEIFIKKYNQIYLDEQILPLLRQIYEIEVIRSKERLRKNTKESNKWKQIECNPNWPICFQKLKKQKFQNSEVDVWVLKQEGNPRIIKDYLSQKQKKNGKAAQDERDNRKKIIIGRMPHICEMQRSKKCRGFDIELNDLTKEEKEQKEQMGQKEGNNQEITIVSMMKDQNQSTTQFFQRLTAGSFLFQHFKNLQRKDV